MCSCNQNINTNCGCSGFPGSNSNCGCNCNCITNEDEGCNPLANFECVIYTGGPLEHINVLSEDNGVTILEKINTAIGEIVIPEPDYTGYNTACIANTNQEVWVEQISLEFCNLSTAYSTFVNTTYSNFTTATNNRLAALEAPNLTSNSCITFVGGDTPKQAMQKIADAVGALCSSIDLAGVNWSSCIVTTPPTTISGAFSAIIGQICSINTTVNNLTPVDWLVKTNGADNNPGTLNDKIVVTSCLTKSVVTDGGVLKLELGLANTPKVYNFNSSDFDVTNTGTSNCQESFTVSLKPIASPPVTCEYLQDNIFSTTTEPVEYLYGSDTDEECAKFTNCQIMEFLFSSYADGEYVIKIEQSQDNLCDRFVLVPFTQASGTVTSVGLNLPGSVFSITGSPVTNSGTLSGSFVNQNANHFFAGPVSGAANTPSFRAIVPDDYKVHPLADNIWKNITFPASGSAGVNVISWTLTSNSSKNMTIMPSVPQYKIDYFGRLHLKGCVGIEITLNNKTPSNKSYMGDILIPIIPNATLGFISATPEYWQLADSVTVGTHSDPGEVPEPYHHSSYIGKVNATGIFLLVKAEVLVDTIILPNINFSGTYFDLI